MIQAGTYLNVTDNSGAKADNSGSSENTVSQGETEADSQAVTEADSEADDSGSSENTMSQGEGEQETRDNNNNNGNKNKDTQGKPGVGHCVFGWAFNARNNNF